LTADHNVYLGSGAEVEVLRSEYHTFPRVGRAIGVQVAIRGRLFWVLGSKVRRVDSP